MAIIAELAQVAGKPSQFPTEGLPEIAMVGRSNVGKSSLINRLLGKKGLARTSNTPGRTQTINFYRVMPEGEPHSAFFLVDLPGYGHAEVSMGKREQWRRLIDDYLSTRRTLCGIIHLLDLRHPPQPLDLQMSAWLRHVEHHFLVVGTKADKIAKTKVPDHLQIIADALNIPQQDTLSFSAETGVGKEELWAWILASTKESFGD